MKALRHRSARVLPATIAGLVIVALAGALLWAAVVRLSTGRWWPQVDDAARTADGAAWTAPWALVAAGVIALAGLILLLCALLPGGFSHARLHAPEAEDGVVRGRVHCVVTTGGLATLASSTASRIDGVSGVSSSASAKSITITLTTPLRSTDSLVAEARAAVEERMRECGVQPVPRIKVQARTKEMS